jgi:hypothetical protein
VIVTARHTPGIRRSTCRICCPRQIILKSRGRCSRVIRFLSLPRDGPDLLGEKFTRQLAEQQFHTLHDFYLNLPIT